MLSGDTIAVIMTPGRFHSRVFDCHRASIHSFKRNGTGILPPGVRTHGDKQSKSFSHDKLSGGHRGASWKRYPNYTTFWAPTARLQGALAFPCMVPMVTKSQLMAHGQGLALPGLSVDMAFNKLWLKSRVCAETGGSLSCCQHPEIRTINPSNA